MIILDRYNTQPVGVFGLGKAGEAAIDALLAGGANVWVADDAAAGMQRMQEKYGDAIHVAPIEDWPWNALACIVLSPGVPFTHPAPHPVVARARAAQCPIKGDIELLYEACPDAMYIGITGTNGKSTTTALIGHILQETGYEVEIGGNLGTPGLALEPLDDTGIYVLELSSYQLDLLDKTRFDIAILLNFTPDHLDRHGDMAGYVASKERIFRNHTVEPADEWARGVAIVAVDDEYTATVADKLVGNPHIDLVRVSTKSEQDVYVAQGILHDNISEAIIPPDAHNRMDLTTMLTLPGAHNWQNAAAAYAAVRVCGVDMDEAQSAMQSFPGLRHRLQLAANIEGIRFINDSKATNADATANALAAYESIYWILGGKSKAGGIATLAPFFPRILHAFLLGEAEDEFARCLEGQVAYSKCGDLARAFEAAAQMALREKQENAVVLLSPACASFDQWKSFEARGDAFCAMAEAWAVRNGEQRHAV